MLLCISLSLLCVLLVCIFHTGALLMVLNESHEQALEAHFVLNENLGMHHKAWVNPFREGMDQTDAACIFHFSNGFPGDSEMCKALTYISAILLPIWCSAVP